MAAARARCLVQAQHEALFACSRPRAVGLLYRLPWPVVNTCRVWSRPPCCVRVVIGGCALSACISCLLAAQ